MKNGVRNLITIISIFVGVTIGVGGALYGHEGRISKCEAAYSTIMNSLNRIESKLDAHLDRHNR